MRRPNGMTLATALSALGLGFFFVVTGQGQGTLPPGDLAKLLAMEAKNIETELSKSTFSKKGQKKVRMAAFMVAVYAQNAKDDPAGMATLRDSALKLMKAADAGNAADAKKLAANLKTNIKDPGAKSAPVALEKELELEYLMRMFSGEKVGGFGLEKALEDLVEAKSVDAAQLEKTALLGQKIGFIAKVSHGYGPESDSGKKTKKAWNELADEMESAAKELATAAKANKGSEISKLADKLSGTCLKCHDIFR